ncbi:MAG: hypothetical protein AAGD14_19800, partial [Planctomycetota bacterium]
MRTALSLSLLLLLAMTVGGCAKKSADDAGGEGMSETPADAGMGEGMDDGMEGAEEGGLTASEAAEAAEADRQGQGELIDRLRTFAEAKYKSGDVAEARTLYQRILQLDPRDQQARAAFDKLSVELGDRAPVASAIIDTEAARIEARRQETVAEINKRLSRARVAESEGDFDTAIRKYEEIDNILRWYPYQGDFPVDERTVRDLISRAQEQRRISLERERQKQLSEVTRIEEERAAVQKDEELRQMRLWLKMANDAYDRGEYDLAQTNAQKVLDLDPKNKQAKKLITIARDTKYNSDRLELREQFNDEWRTIMERLEFDAMPHPE